MKIIERTVIQDGSDLWRLRALISKLRARISLYNTDPEDNLDAIKQLLHEIEFDFGDHRFIQPDLDILLEAHNIIKENK